MLTTLQDEYYKNLKVNFLESREKMQSYLYLLINESSKHSLSSDFCDFAGTSSILLRKNLTDDELIRIIKHYFYFAYNYVDELMIDYCFSIQLMNATRDMSSYSSIVDFIILFLINLNEKYLPKI